MIKQLKTTTYDFFKKNLTKSFKNWLAVAIISSAGTLLLTDIRSVYQRAGDIVAAPGQIQEVNERLDTFIPLLQNFISDQKQTNRDLEEFQRDQVQFQTTVLEALDTLREDFRTLIP